MAPIRPLAWESPYAVGAALKEKDQKKFICNLPVFMYWQLKLSNILQTKLSQQVSSLRTLF